MTRLAVLSFAILLTMSGAHAQGTLPNMPPPAPAVVPPPPPVAAPPVPSVVTPLPSPSYGVPRGVTAPVYSGGTPSIRYEQKKRHRFRGRRHHRSS